LVEALQFDAGIGGGEVPLPNVMNDEWY